MAKLNDILKNGGTLTRGTKVKLPVVGEAYIYGFVPINDDDFFEFSILNDLDGPALGPACIIGNRVIFSLDGKFCRFPVFSTIHVIDKEKYPVYLLYVPKLLKSPCTSHVSAYKHSMQNEKPHQYIGKVNGIKILDGTAYYFPQPNEFLFQSLSTLKGIANNYAVITRRTSGDNEIIVYEIFNPSEIEIID